MEIASKPHGFIPSTRALQPEINGSTVVALKYRDGVMMAADTLLTRGYSCKMFSNQRLIRINNKCVVGASGDHGDWQHICDQLLQIHQQDEVMNDQFEKSAEEFHSLLARILYQKRNEMKPLCLSCVVMGLNAAADGFYIGSVDMVGTKLTEDHWATAYGSYFILPRLRSTDTSNYSLDEAKTLLRECLTVTASRDCTSSEEIQWAVVNWDGAHIGMPERVQPRVDYQNYKTLW